MRRRPEHLVQKRDGRTEFLRATKLARSVHLALHSVGIDEDWRALEMANIVLAALRQKRAGSHGEAPPVLTTAELGDAVQHLLVVTGQPQAAVAYGAIAAERSRRRHALATLDPLATIDSLGTDSLGTLGRSSAKSAADILTNRGSFGRRIAPE